MKRVRRCILQKVILPFVLIILFFSYEAGAKVIEKIVAVVNGDIIILSELKEISVPYLEKMKSKFSLDHNEEQIRKTERRILDQLIDERLVKQEADRLKIVIEEKEVDLAIRDMMESSKLTEDQFKQVLVEEGMTLEKYKEQLKNQLQKMRLLEQEIKSKVQVTNEEIKDYYNKHRSSFDTPLEIRLQQILLMVPPEAGEQEINQIREKAEEILQKIRKGEDFNTMVKLYSQDSYAAAGGDMGVFRRGELVSVIDEAAFSLNVGEVSPVIQTSLGFHILRVLEKRDRGKMTEEERLKEIEGIIYNKKVESKYKQWLKELRKKSYIKISL